jgi:hypothetical protein
MKPIKFRDLKKGLTVLVIDGSVHKGRVVSIRGQMATIKLPSGVELFYYRDSGYRERLFPYSAELHKAVLRIALQSERHVASFQRDIVRYMETVARLLSGPENEVNRIVAEMDELLKPKIASRKRK